MSAGKKLTAEEKEREGEALQAVDVSFLVKLVEESKVVKETGYTRKRELWLEIAQRYMTEKTVPQSSDNLIFFSNILKKKWLKEV